MKVIDVTEVVAILLLLSCSLLKVRATCPGVHGGTLIARASVDTPGHTGVNIGSPITCDGYVTGWRFFPTVSAQFVALVMRPHVAADGEYAVVGRTVIPAQQQLDRKREFTLQESDWISVKSGDVIGFNFAAALLPFDNTGTEITAFVFVHGVGHQSLLVHTIHTITYNDGDRAYSFQAVLKESYLPCHILNWPLMETTTSRTTVLNVWMDDWNKIKCPGTITGWRFIAAGPGDIVGLVFRAVDADSNQYEIIGKTTIPDESTVTDVVAEFPLSYSERIDVLPGDKIGFTYTGGPMYFTTTYSNVGSIYKYISKPNVVEIGTQVTFTNYLTRRYMFDAVLDVKEPNYVHHSPYIVNGWRLQNNDIETITSSSSLTNCVTNCIEKQECKSVNYNQQQKTCQLNDATVIDDAVNFGEDAGERYAEMNQKITNVAGNCAFVDCGHGNMCIDVPGAIGRHLCMCLATGYLAKQCPSAECLQPLGMESRDIVDDSLSSSSTYSHPTISHGPECSRLNAQATLTCTPCWIPADSDTNRWIQIHMVIEHTITGIQTQGRPTYEDQWVTTYSISYIKVNQTGETFISEGHGTPKVFDGNWDGTSTQTHYFNPVIQAVAIRIYPKSWYTYASLRAEVLGCRIGNEWVRVFKGVSMTGVSIYNAWQTGTGVSSYHTHQFLTSDTFYRNNAVFNNWESYDIQKVKLTLFSAFNKELLSVIFNGVGSTATSWFSRDRVESSPWHDIKTASCLVFSIEGDSTRRFYMSSSHNGCEGDTGWFVVNEGAICQSWDGYSTNPRILYSRTTSAQIWYSGDIGTARAMTFDVTLG